MEPLCPIPLVYHRRSRAFAYPADNRCGNPPHLRSHSDRGDKGRYAHIHPSHQRMGSVGMYTIWP
jgi:hypothetical protein